MKDKKKGIISNPNLAPYIKESVIAYQDFAMLSYFFTSICIPNYLNKYINYLPEKLQNNLKRRAFDQLKTSHLKTSIWRETLRILTTKFGNNNLADYVWEWAEKSFDKNVARHVSKDTLFFHGYEHACYYSLKKAKQLGIKIFYEQPSQHHTYFTKIVEEQLALYPELISEATLLLNDDKAKRRNERRDAELLLSDYIICNSTFTKYTLLKAGISQDKLIVIPYGFPAITPIVPKSNKCIRFIYAGNLSLRKGIHLLIAAWKLVSKDLNCELILMGSQQLPVSIFDNLPENIKFIPNQPYEKAQALIKTAHVFVLPTLADGFGMVISESMAAGVPVITTKASAGLDLIEPFKDGLLIESANINALYDAISWCITHNNQLAEMGLNAQRKASLYPWDAYRKKLVQTVRERIDE